MKQINILSAEEKAKFASKISQGIFCENGKCVLCGCDKDSRVTIRPDSDEFKKYMLCFCGHFYIDSQESCRKDYKYKNQYNSENENFLRNKKIELMEYPEYSKYGLISIDQAEDILLDQIPLRIKKVIDKNPYYIHVDENIEPLMCIVQKSMAGGEIQQLAVRPEECQSIFDKNIQIMCEAKEWGKYFNLEMLQENIKDIQISKLYDDEYYCNSLWIKIDAQNREITFEEIISNDGMFSIFCVTQVVHLKYFLDTLHNYYLEHLDHEFIAYTPEQFDKRKQDVMTKGNKVKTIKIDESRIPFIKNGIVQPFLLYFLEHFFQQTQLIREYFETHYQFS